jgi:hypothetical protein
VQGQGAGIPTIGEVLLTLHVRGEVGNIGGTMYFCHHLGRVSQLQAVNGSQATAAKKDLLDMQREVCVNKPVKLAGNVIHGHVPEDGTLYTLDMRTHHALPPSRKLRGAAPVKYPGFLGRMSRLHATSGRVRTACMRCWLEYYRYCAMTSTLRPGWRTN